MHEDWRRKDHRSVLWINLHTGKFYNREKKSVTLVVILILKVAILINSKSSNVKVAILK